MLGRPGRIVVSTGLLRRPDASERRALLAHERAHLAGGHHVHNTAAHLAAAASPLLGRLAAAVALACERRADETAAACRRSTIAEALAPRLRWWRVALLIRLLAATAATLAEAMHDTERLFELAQVTYGGGQR